MYVMVASQKKERQQQETGVWARVKEMGKKSRNPGDNFHAACTEGKKRKKVDDWENHGLVQMYIQPLTTTESQTNPH